MTAETFSPGTKGIITNLVKRILQEQVEMLLSMVDNEHLKCTATLPLYITLESAVSWTNFPRFCYLNFMKSTFLGFHGVVLVKIFPLMY